MLSPSRSAEDLVKSSWFRAISIVLAASSLPSVCGFSPIPAASPSCRFPASLASRSTEAPCSASSPCLASASTSRPRLRSSAAATSARVVATQAVARWARCSSEASRTDWAQPRHPAATQTERESYRHPVLGLDHPPDPGMLHVVMRLGNHPNRGHRARCLISSIKEVEQSPTVQALVGRCICLHSIHPGRKSASEILFNILR